MVRVTSILVEARHVNLAFVLAGRHSHHHHSMTDDEYSSDCAAVGVAPQRLHLEQEIEVLLPVSQVEHFVSPVVLAHRVVVSATRRFLVGGTCFDSLWKCQRNRRSPLLVILREEPWLLLCVTDGAIHFM